MKTIILTTLIGLAIASALYLALVLIVWLAFWNRKVTAKKPAAASINSTIKRGWKWVRLAIKQRFCKHWWKRVTEYKWNAKFTERTIAQKTGVCVLCGHSMVVKDWDEIPANTRSKADREKLIKAGKAGQ